MSYVAISGYHPMTKLTKAIKELARTVGGSFETLGFESKNQGKTLYIRLSEKLDPMMVVQRIQDCKTGVLKKLRPYIPVKIPDFLMVKGKKLTAKLCRTYHLPMETSDEEMLVATQEEIMQELQYKYNRLWELSQSTGHKLFNDLIQVIFDRVKQIMCQYEEDSSFKLTSRYRKLHPHFGDFQLILSTLHRIQDETGKPRTQMSEEDLIGKDIREHDLMTPGNTAKTQKIGQKYAEKLAAKITEHINSLDCSVDPDDSEMEASRKKVREELKKMAGYMPVMIRQVITQNLAEKQTKAGGGYLKMVMYGEPYLPNKLDLRPILQPAGVISARRSERMYNALKVVVASSNYPKLMKINNTTFQEAKLYVRTTKKMYVTPGQLIAEAKKDFKASKSRVKQEPGQQW